MIAVVDRPDRIFGTIIRIVTVPTLRFVEIAADRRDRVRLKVQVNLFDVLITDRPLPLRQTFGEGGWLVSLGVPFIEDGPASRRAWFASAPLIDTEVIVIETIALPAGP